MAKYLIQATYSAAGVKGLLKEGGSSRRAAVAKAVAGIGGKLESLYYAFGKVDCYIIIVADARGDRQGSQEDRETPRSRSITKNSHGHMQTKVLP